VKDCSEELQLYALDCAKSLLLSSTEQLLLQIYSEVKFKDQQLAHAILLTLNVAQHCSNKAVKLVQYFTRLFDLL